MSIFPRRNSKNDLGSKPIRPIREVVWVIFVAAVTCILVMLGLWSVVRLLSH